MLDRLQNLSRLDDLRQFLEQHHIPRHQRRAQDGHLHAWEHVSAMSFNQFTTGSSILTVA